MSVNLDFERIKSIEFYNRTPLEQLEFLRIVDGIPEGTATYLFFNNFFTHPPKDAEGLKRSAEELSSIKDNAFTARVERTFAHYLLKETSKIVNKEELVKIFKLRSLS